MKTYVVLSSESIVGLAEIVNQGLAGDWEVAGGMVLEYRLPVEGEVETKTWYHQVMLRPTEVKVAQVESCPSCGAMELHTSDCPHDGNG